MPKYVLEDIRKTLKPAIFIEGGEVEIGLTDMTTGTYNVIGSLTISGKLRLHGLSEGWAEKAGIQCDKEGKIQLV